MHHQTSPIVLAGILAVVAPLRGGSLAQAQPAELLPTDDNFVRQSSPTICYGTAGALYVAAPGLPGGRADTVLRFDTTAAAQQFDAAFGVGAWTLNSAVLQLGEVGTPFNPIFSQGVGEFEVRWLSTDAWVEGMGSPFNPTFGMGNQMTWNLLQTLLAVAAESPLGTFSNSDPDITELQTYTLELMPPLVADVRACDRVTLHLQAASATIGFVFHSGDYQATDTTHPRLFLTAEAASAVPGDVNGDFDVDLLDHAALVAALTGPGTALTSPCERADLDADDDVDLADTALLQNAFVEG